jgi:hypothetical protein
MAGEASTPSRRGLDPMLVAIGLVAALVILAGVAVVGGLGPFGPGGAPPPASVPGAGAATAMPSAPSVPSSAASGGLAIDGLVEATADGLPVMESAGLVGMRVGTLPAGQQALVVAGPVEADELAWYLLSGLGLAPNTGCEEPITIADCPGWIGWVPAADGVASLRLAEPQCPSLTDYESFATRQPLIQLVCAGGREVSLTAWWPGRSPYHTCIDSPPGVDWLYCAPALVGWLAPSPGEVGSSWLAVAVDPASGVTLPEPGRWVEVRGHVDDPAAEACRVVPGAPDAERGGWAQVLQCRSTLVVESMVEVTAPAG